MTGPVWDGKGTDPWLPARLEARLEVAGAEQDIRRVVWAQLSGWLVQTGRAVMRGERPAPEAIWARVPAWREAVDFIVRGEIRRAFGAAFRRILPGARWDQRVRTTAYLAEVRNRLVRIPDEVYGLVTHEVAVGVNLGEGIPELRKRIDAVLSTTESERWPNRATVIARTETIGALNAGRMEAFLATAEAEPDVQFEVVWLCVLPDTPVVAADVQLAARRWYDGEVRELRTASGRRVTLTPEHPVLTTEGWLPAKAVKLGHQLLSVPIVDPVGTPDVKADHTSIEQYFNAAAESGEVRTLTREVPCGVYFNGNLTREKVDVVSVARDLTADVKPGTDQDFLDLCLELPDKAFGRLVVERAIAHGRVGDQDSGTFPGGLTNSFWGPVPSGPEDSGLTLVSDVHTGKSEHAADSVSADGQAFAQSVDGLPALVALDDVVGVEVRTWRGHVYDLSTSCHWFLADGIVVHNSTSDSRTRPTHVEADGQRVPLGQQFVVGGFPLWFPGDPSGPPQECIQCRCTPLLVEQGETIDYGNRQYRRDR